MQKILQFILVLWLLPCLAFAAPILNQTGNLLTNGNLEGGNFNPVVSGTSQSAANNWYQWSNSGNAPTTEMITEAEMQSLTGVGVIDGTAALRVKTLGSSDGPYTVASLHSAWNAAGVSSVPYTFSGWVYVVSGAMTLAAGSNSYGYNYRASTKIGQWEFISVTQTSNLVDELLIYSTGPTEFIVDSLWLNRGSVSTHVQQTIPSHIVPEISSLWLLLGAALVILRKKS